MKKTTLFLVLAALAALPALAQASAPVPAGKKPFMFLADASFAQVQELCSIVKCDEYTLVISRTDAEKAGKGTVLVDIDADEFCKEFVCDENTVRAKRARRAARR